MSDVETFEFQTETRQLLDLMVHSIYSNKDIFLRELISNSSDALDRRRFESLSKPDIAFEDEACIWIEPDPEARTITVRDNGIGMSRDEVVRQIGTIAKSGTREFLEKMRQAREASTPELIGQFGVGFYSSFMAGDEVTLVTRRADEPAGTRWHSSGDGTYTLEEVDAPTGTSVTVHLKPADEEDGLKDYTQEWVIREIVKHYSDFVAYPIYMNIEREEVDRDDEGKPVEGATPQKVTTKQTLNSMKAIWLRDKNEVDEEEYHEFYKHISHDWNEPLTRIQATIEGTLLYRMLLFIPSRAPFDMFHRDSHQGVHLYVKRVFIMEDCKALIPEYLRFIRGVVDSEDLSLNISREILQQNRQIQRMRKGVVSKVLDALKALRKNKPEDYTTFWRVFGRVLKEGLYQDRDNNKTLLDLVMAESTQSDDGLVSLREYVDRMKPEQDAIYYMTGESRAAIENSPHLEAFRDKGYEVLLLTDPVDEIWTESTPAFEDTPLKSVGKGAVELGTDEEKKAAEEKRKEQEKELGSLLERLKQPLEEQVKEVRLSQRLRSSAACLITDENDMTPQMEQLMRAMGQGLPNVKRILELNPAHPVLEKLQTIYSDNNDAPALDDYARLLYGQAVLAEGGQLPDPGTFAKLVADLMVKSL